jgi:hypothetical protein
MLRLIRRLLLPPIAAASLLLTAAGVALAEAESTVAVFNADGTPAGATVCEFYFEFSAAPGGESGSWELRDGGGTAVASGSYSVTTSTADREPNTGSLTFPNGTYTLVWDDETPIDNSNEQLQVMVECADETEPPTPGPTPVQSVEDETDAPTPFQSVEGDTDAPDRTQPDTTGVKQVGSPDSGALTGLLAVILGLAAFVYVLTPKRGMGRR